MLELVRRLKYDSFLVGALPADLLNLFGPIGSRMPFPVAVTHYRKTLVNRSPQVTKRCAAVWPSVIAGLTSGPV